MERNERMFSIALAVVFLCLTAVVSTTLWLSVQRMPPHNADYMTRGEVEAYVDSIGIFPKGERRASERVI